MNIRILYIIAVAAVLSGCAKREDPDLDPREQQAFDSWMAATHPEATRMENGMYVEWLQQTDSETAKPVIGSDWVSVDYLVRDLEGNIMGTRSEEVAREEGTFTPVTHYVPDFAMLDSELRYFTPGEYEILPMMKVNDSVRLYLPSNLAYRNADITFVNGYEGWRYSAANPLNSSTGVPRAGRAVTIDLALRDIVSSPAAIELDLVNLRGMDLEPVSDTIPGLYYEIVASNDPAAEIIPVDSTAWITWTCRFLEDGKLVATNDRELAIAEWKDYSSRYLTFDPFTASGSSPIKGSALQTAVKHELIKYNSTIRLIYISDFGYGGIGAPSVSSENQAPRPVIFPYTPLMLEVTVMPEDYNKIDDDSEDSDN